jgi:hypothetical protein
MNQAKVNESDIEHVGPQQGSISISRTNHEGEHDEGHAVSWRDINRMLFVALAAGAIWFLGGVQNPSVTGIGVICTLVGGFPIFSEAYENIVQRRMTMELSPIIVELPLWVVGHHRCPDIRQRL